LRRYTTTNQKAEESIVNINNFETQCLVDDVSMITTASEEYFNQFNPQTILHTIDKLEVHSSDGNQLPYIGHIEGKVLSPEQKQRKLLCQYLMFQIQHTISRY
jgi:prolyl oligopeptidase PreP (S9A serine peptidase family)